MNPKSASLCLHCGDRHLSVCAKSVGLALPGRLGGCAVKLALLVLCGKFLLVALVAFLPLTVFGVASMVVLGAIFGPLLAPLVRPITGLFKLAERLFALTVGVGYLRAQRRKP